MVKQCRSSFFHKCPLPIGFRQPVTDFGCGLPLRQPINPEKKHLFSKSLCKTHFTTQPVFLKLFKEKRQNLAAV